jgi:hypothetical protein
MRDGEVIDDVEAWSSPSPQRTVAILVDDGELFQGRFTLRKKSRAGTWLEDIGSGWRLQSLGRIKPGLGFVAF